MTFPFRRFGWASAVVVVLATMFPSSAAQSGAAQSAAQLRTTAERAFLAGRYDEVERLAANSSDEALIVLRAKALMARGDYTAAEKLLMPAAAVAPGGDAALELGLLQLYLGRRSEGRRAMQLVLLAEVRSATARD